MKLIRTILNWIILILLIALSPLIFICLFIAFCIDKIILVVKHNKKYLLDGTNWITEVFK